jgi:hypothetical protein
MIYCFGDSWSYGSELNENENPFVYHLAKDLGEKFINFSSQGNSYSVIVTRIFGNVRDINSDDTILIVIPPDIRWMDQQQGSFISWYYEADKERYMSWLGDKTEVWFRYHASLFTYSIQSALDGIGCKYLFMHNYGGEFIIDSRFKSLINVDNFLNIKKSLTTLLGGEDSYESWNLKSDGPEENNKDSGKYFEGNDTHPNELGHKRIVELIKEKI